MNIFCDIDATLTFYDGTIASIYEGQKLLPGTLEKLEEWSRKGYKVILTTARRESMRGVTEEALKRHRITYDLLLMGLHGTRVIINDRDSKGNDRAIGINLDKNVGIGEIQL